MPAGPATAKAKKPVSLKKDNGVARGARMPKRLHAMKIYYRARGCWSNNRSHSGEERTERGEEKKARIFRLIDVINLGFFFVQISSSVEVVFDGKILCIRILESIIFRKKKYSDRTRFNFS